MRLSSRFPIVFYHRPATHKYPTTIDPLTKKRSLLSSQVGWATVVDTTTIYETIIETISSTIFEKKEKKILHSLIFIQKSYLRFANVDFTFYTVTSRPIVIYQASGVADWFRSLQAFPLRLERREASPSDRFFPIQLHEIRPFPLFLNQIASLPLVQRGKLISIRAVQHVSRLLGDVHVAEHPLVLHGHAFHPVANFRVFLQRHHVAPHSRTPTWLYLISCRYLKYQQRFGETTGWELKFEILKGGTLRFLWIIVRGIIQGVRSLVKYWQYCFTKGSGTLFVSDSRRKHFTVLRKTEFARVSIPRHWFPFGFGYRLLETFREILLSLDNFIVEIYLAEPSCVLYKNPANYPIRKNWSDVRKL